MLHSYTHTNIQNAVKRLYNRMYVPELAGACLTANMFQVQVTYIQHCLQYTWLLLVLLLLIFPLLYSVCLSERELLLEEPVLVASPSPAAAPTGCFISAAPGTGCCCCCCCWVTLDLGNGKLGTLVWDTCIQQNGIGTSCGLSYLHVAHSDLFDSNCPSMKQAF